MNDTKVLVAIGAGGIGQAIARRLGAGKTILLADLNDSALHAAADSLRSMGHHVVTAKVDVASRESVHKLAGTAASLGDVVHVSHTAGVAMAQASTRAILAVDLYGTALVLEEFAAVIAPGGTGIVISSQAGHMGAPLEPAQTHALAFTPTEELLDLPFLDPAGIPESGTAYVLSKRANHLRVQSAALAWGERGARVNSISPGIILTPLAQEELDSERGPAYQAMIQASPARRVGTTDEVAATAAFLLGPESGFITGTDLLMDGGVIAAMAGGRIGLGQ